MLRLTRPMASEPGQYFALRFFSGQIVSPRERLLQQYDESGVDDFRLNDRNETNLHTAILFGLEIDTIKRMEAEVGVQGMADLSKITDDAGNIPAHHFSVNLHRMDASFTVLFRLYHYMACTDISPLNKGVPLSEEMKGITVAESKAYYRYMDAAYEAVNFSRSLFHSSSTHPDALSYSSEKNNRITRKISEARDLRDIFIRSEIKASTKSGSPIDVTSLELMTNFEDAKSLGYGNCSEMAKVSMYYIDKKFPGIQAELYGIDNGDHAFVVIGRNLKTKADDPYSWNASTVICDPFVGDYYPVTQINKRLFNFECVDVGVEEKKTVCVPSTYNPRFHQLRSGIKLLPDMDDKAKSSYISLT